MASKQTVVGRSIAARRVARNKHLYLANMQPLALQGVNQKYANAGRPPVSSALSQKRRLWQRTRTVLDTIFV